MADGKAERLIVAAHRPDVDTEEVQVPGVRGWESPAWPEVAVRTLIAERAGIAIYVSWVRKREWESVKRSLVSMTDRHAKRFVISGYMYVIADEA